MIALLFASVASAATVAVLDFDGYGVSFSDAQTAAQGVRDAFLESGKLDPLSGSDIADGVSKGQDAALSRARDLVSEGRRLYASGDSAAALDPLAEAIELHEGADSSVGRRPELADATFLYGLCLLKAGRSADARVRFGEAAFLVPQYAKERGTRMSSEAAGLLAAAEDTLARGARKTRPAAGIGRIAEALSVDYVVTGWVGADGALSARLFAGDQLVSEAKVMLDERPPLPVDAGYGTLVALLTEAGLTAPVSEPEPEVLPEEEAEQLDAEDTPDFDEGPSPAGPRAAAAAPRAAAAGTSSAKVKIKDSGAMKIRRPIVEQWWFWTSAVAVAGGGTFGLVYALTPPPTEYVEEPDGWSVSVTTPE